MSKKTIIITGANSGIGYETALHFAKRGDIIAMVCRSKQKGETAKTEIERLSGNKDISLIIADLSSVNQSRQLAKTLAEKYPVIDVLVNNAGSIIYDYIETEDGYESTFAANHLAYFILANGLLENLKRAPEGRIINVASEAQRAGGLNFDNINLKGKYDPIKAYCQSKLANIVFTYELAKRLEGTNVTTNCMHPGTVRTGFGMQYKGIIGSLFRMVRPFMRGSKKGAETIIWLAESPELKGVNGKYYYDKKAIKSIPTSYDPAVQKRLWDLSEEMIKFKVKGDFK
ncbi:MAG: SDR family oxidoreductase [Ignavibacteriaceae bacterium]|nr:SDR family oxidoreductase [Ignavibacteriaceae bacterium]